MSSAASVTEFGRRAPEFGLVMAEHSAAGAAIGSGASGAELTVAAILNRLGRNADAATRAGVALRGADGEVAAALRVELARCALDAGFAVAALAVLRPVIAYRRLSPVPRAAALVTAAEALTACGRPGGARDALEAAEELCADHDEPDLRLLRVEAQLARARQYRRDGAAESAEAEARAGLDMLGGPDPDGGERHARLVLEVVLALLDRAAPATASSVAEGVLGQPLRPTTAGPAAWIALALATRAKLPAGQHRPALQLLTDAVRGAERHGLDAPLVGCEDALAQLHEERGELADALAHLRNARAAEYRRRVAVETVREVLDDHLPPGRERAEAPDAVAVLIRDQLTDAHRRPNAPPSRGRVPEVAYGLPGEVDPLARRVPRMATPVTPTPPASPPPASTSVSPAPTNSTPTNSTPSNSTPSNSTPSNSAADSSAADTSAADTSAADTSVPPTPPTDAPAPATPATDTPATDTPAPPAAASEPDDRHERPAVEHARPEAPAEDRPAARAETPDEEESGGHARHRGDGSRRVPVSELLSAGLASPRPGGRRRAEDRDQQPAPEPGPGAPSAAPELRTLDRADTDISFGGGGPDAGLGDLLYEALAAFHRGQSSTAAQRGHGRHDVPAESGPPLSEVWPPPPPGRRSTTGD